MERSTIVIEIFFVSGMKDGKKYKVPHTTAFGVNMSVQLNGGLNYYKGEDGNYYIEYDPKKAGFKVNEKGYNFLQITK